MSAFFLKIISMSISASWLVLAVLLLRLVLKKAPKWVSVLLWGFVALRLLMPFSIESQFSLVPEQLVDGQIISSGTDILSDEMGKMEIYVGDRQEGQQLVSSAVPDRHFVKTEGYSLRTSLSMIWLAGVAVMLAYTLISYALLKRKVATGVWIRKNIYLCENTASPFVLGLIRPKIYLPYWLDDRAVAHVVAHEEAHIRRKDHWWKPIGFVLLSLHWFNPLMWLAYILLSRDIELACDEKVIKAMDNESKADYTQVLVDCSINRNRIAACPLAFGEVGVKERVRSVMNYKKPGFWIILAATLVCIAVAVCFLTDPKEQPNPVIVLSSQNYAVEEVTFENGIYSFAVIAGENSPVYSITNDMYLSSQGEYGEGETWTELGKLEEIELTSGNFDELFKFSFWAEGANALKIRRETQQAWKLIYDDEFLYYLLQQKNGDLYLAYGYTSKSFGEASIRWLFKLAAQSNDLGPVETIHGNLKTYYKNADDTYQMDGYTYQYRLEITGRMPNAAMDSTFVFLSNLETISFERAWKAAGLSSYSGDYFAPEEAVLVEWRSEEAVTETEPVTEPVVDETLVDPPLDVLDVAISEAILKQYRSSKLEGPLNAESHIILGRASISGTPLMGAVGNVGEEIVLVYYVNQRFCLSEGYLDECTGNSGEAVITFSVDENGEYIFKDFIEAADYNQELLKTFASDLEPIREKEKEYTEYLRISCWNTTSSYQNYLQTLGPIDFSSVDFEPFVDKRVLDLDADGKEDLCYGTAVELLSAL